MTFLTMHTYEQLDFLAVAENIYISRTAINEPLTGSNMRETGSNAD